MITYVRGMTVNELANRKDDLIISNEDIHEIAKNVRNTAIDEFAEQMSLEISESIIWGMLVNSDKDNSFSDTSDKIVDYVVYVSKKIAEQMKGGAVNG